MPRVEPRVLEGERGDELAVYSPAAMDGYVDRPEPIDERIERADGTRWIRTDVAGAVPNQP
ncbi:hypothetical protein [Natronorubrum aibiense]|uniref:AMP-binding protein n=1 Tax=Natronorubrum aibiense TaxID=348826 RepID=A0A5P9P6I2_9EURY|nr:hypothetical protein [Natronorubrum aibiense]QFU83742.1 hypothetical protein GCU68_14960 [Natronorubrum aibiense]